MSFTVELRYVGYRNILHLLDNEIDYSVFLVVDHVVFMTRGTQEMLTVYTELRCIRYCTFSETLNDYVTNVIGNELKYLSVKLIKVTADTTYAFQSNIYVNSKGTMY